MLIDGAELVEFMFDYGVGGSTASRYTVKRIDSDFSKRAVVQKWKGRPSPSKCAGSLGFSQKAPCLIYLQY